MGAGAGAGAGADVDVDVDVYTEGLGPQLVKSKVNDRIVIFLIVFFVCSIDIL